MSANDRMRSLYSENIYIFNFERNKQINNEKIPCELDLIYE